MPGKIGSAIGYTGKNGIGSFMRYARDRYITHSADRGLVWGLSSKKRSPQVIASMTTYPARIEKVHIALRSLLVQSMKPDRLMLWLATEQFPDGHDGLPESLKELEDFGLEIHWCEDLRSHKKYLPAMRENPDAIVCVFDDDLAYDPDSIEVLYSSYLRHPDAVSALRTHLIYFYEDGTITPYLWWFKEYNGCVDMPRMQLFSTSGAGTLYPPHCLPSETFDIAAIRTLAPTADDIWLKCMQALAGTQTVLARPYPGLYYIDGTQDGALYLDNQYGGDNDRQLAAVLEAYSDKTPDGIALPDRLKDPDWESIGCPDGPWVWKDEYAVPRLWWPER